MDSIKTTDINETQGLPIVEPTSFLGYKLYVLDSLSCGQTIHATAHPLCAMLTVTSSCVL